MLKLKEPCVSLLLTDTKQDKSRPLYSDTSSFSATLPSSTISLAISSVMSVLAFFSRDDGGETSISLASSALRLFGLFSSADSAFSSSLFESPVLFMFSFESSAIVTGLVSAVAVVACTIFQMRGREKREQPMLDQKRVAMRQRQF